MEHPDKVYLYLVARISLDRHLREEPKPVHHNYATWDYERRTLTRALEEAEESLVAALTYSGRV